MKKSKLLLIASLVLALTMTLGSTLAYLTDMDSETNTFTMGKVDIELEEVFDQNANLWPGEETNKDAEIKNEGATPAWVWMTVVVPENLKDYVTPVWASEAIKNSVTTATDAEGNLVYTYLVPTTLAAGASTGKILDAMEMSALVDIRSIDGVDYWVIIEGGEPKPIAKYEDKLDVTVYAYAVQEKGFESVQDAYTAYNAQYSNGNGGSSGEGDNEGGENQPTDPDEGDDDEPTVIWTEVDTLEALTAAIAEGGNIKLTESITTTATITIPANTTVVLNLNGKTLYNETVSVLINKGTLTIMDGTITSGRTIAVQNWSTGTLTVNDATLSSVQNTGIATLNNVTVNGTYRFALYSYNEGVITVNSGNYTGGFSDSAKARLIIKGGTFSVDPSQYVADGYTATQNADGTWTVK
ncbi:MAG: hypothetical protein IJA83_04800 [Clostridia bacterium]|nr:hypothetical protein [Clostridia bacterium]